MNTVKKTTQAAALQYDSAVHGAPIIIAKGEGPMAEEIICAARKHGIPVMQDHSLLPFLMQTGLLQEIPAGLYTAVAMIFKKLMDIDGKLIPSHGEKL